MTSQKIRFKLQKPEPKEQVKWPTWHPALSGLVHPGGESVEIDLLPEYIWYNRENARYAILIEGIPGYGLQQIPVATKWLRQVGSEDKYIVCLRPKKPFRWACLRHFLKKCGTPWSNVKNMVTAKHARLAVIADKNLIDGITHLGLAHIHIIGREQKEEKPQTDTMDDLFKNYKTQWKLLSKKKVT